MADPEFETALGGWMLDQVYEMRCGSAKGTTGAGDQTIRKEISPTGEIGIERMGQGNI